MIHLKFVFTPGIYNGSMSGVGTLPGGKLVALTIPFSFTISKRASTRASIRSFHLYILNIVFIALMLFIVGDIKVHVFMLCAIFAICTDTFAKVAESTSLYSDELGSRGPVDRKAVGLRRLGFGSGFGASLAVVGG